MGGNGRQKRRFIGISAGLPEFDRFGITLKQKLEQEDRKCVSWEGWPALPSRAFSCLGARGAKPAAAKAPAESGLRRAEDRGRARDQGRRHRRQGPRGRRRLRREEHGRCRPRDLRRRPPAAAPSPRSTASSSREPRADPVERGHQELLRTHLEVDRHHSNDPERPQMNLFIKAMVKPFVDVLPRRSSASRSSRATRRPGRHPPLRGEGLPPDDRRPRSPTSRPRSSPPATRTRSPDARRAVQGPRSRAPDAPEGLLNAPIRVATGVTQQPTIEIPVSGSCARACRSRR